jgi:hypothetical protein
MTHLLEASLSRIYRDFQNNEFCILTAWRVGDSGNKSNLNQLQSAIRSAGFGFVRIDGVGQEEVNGKVVSVNEPSLLVKNVGKGGGAILPTRDFLKFVISLARKYDQWGIVFNNPNDGAKLISLKDELGNQRAPRVEGTFTKFHPMKTAQFFSKLKGKPFTFEVFKYANPPENWIHGMQMEQNGEVDIFRYIKMDEWLKKN